MTSMTRLKAWLDGTGNIQKIQIKPKIEKYTSLKNQYRLRKQKDALD